MPGLGTLTVDLAADVANLRKDFNQANRAVNKATKDIAQSANTARLALVGVVSALGVNRLVGTLRSFESLKASLETVTGSSAAAQEAFAWIEDFAATTPFQLEEVVSGFIKLQSLGLEPTEAALRSFGNTASAMGKSLDQFIEAVADGVTGEFERLKEFGIKASKDGDRVTFTFRGIATTVQNSAADIQRYLRNIGDVDFAGAMEKRAATLDGALSNLQDSFSALARSIGDTGLTSLIADAARAISSIAGEAAAAAREGGPLSLLEGAMRGIFELNRGNDAKRLGTLLNEELELTAKIREIQDAIVETSSRRGGVVDVSLSTALDNLEQRKQRIEEEIKGLELALSTAGGERGFGGGRTETPPPETAPSSPTSGDDKEAKKRAEAIKKVTENLRFEIEQLLRSNEQQEIYNALRAAGVAADSAAGRQIAGLVTEREELIQLNEAELDAQKALEDAKKKRLADEEALRASEESALENIQRQILLFGELDEVETAILETTRGMWAEYSEGAKQALIANSAVLKGLREQQEAQEEAAKAAEEAAKRAAEVGKDLGLTFSSAFEDAIVEGKKFSDILKGIEQDVLRIAARRLITEPLGDALSSAFSGGGILGALTGKRAAGGPVTAGGTYLVGERGPELFVPPSSGQIVPNNRLAGGTVINVNVAGVTDADSFRRSVPQIQAQMLAAASLAHARDR